MSRRTSSSAENLTVSSELFTECRNWLGYKVGDSTSIGVNEDLTPPADSEHVKGTLNESCGWVTADKEDVKLLGFLFNQGIAQFWGVCSKYLTFEDGFI
jgi:hypothetical protein